MDLSNLSASDLRNLQEQIKRELKKRESQDLQKAKEEIFAIAQRVGLPLKELINTNPRGKGSTVAARYRNPGDDTQQWTGRGRQPKWVKEWLDSGKAIDDLRI
ncbi:DNA-binding protein H-NS [Pseudoduganella lurida]|uniref:DNA-binding protein H-NS n=1 Tax=Pseudoduganella lurida TaxID=1036180 RepID=A0A562R6M3_9BURK|nr:H-NS histone family protein [Pseudoduganella lurida]TWI64224.1 DNA-binding protein H-NS [Pseudoduganella lurida]